MFDGDQREDHVDVGRGTKEEGVLLRVAVGERVCPHQQNM